MIEKRSAQISLSAVALVFALSLSACSDSENKEDDQAFVEDKTKPSVLIKKVLPLDPIDLATANAPQRNASRSVPVCPWLSDTSANAAVDNVLSTEPMLRRSVSADECKWNVNLGFAFRISAVPSSEAVNPNSVMYNMDNAPVLEPQNGPGSDAVALLDATWDAASPRPFAYMFSTDDRQFKITTTGVKTSIERLRSVADEIVDSLSNPISAPDPAGAEATLDPCVYEGTTVAGLFGGTSSDSLSETPNIAGSSCKYSGIIGDAGIELTLRFSGDPLIPPNSKDTEYEVLNRFGADVYSKNKPSTTSYGSATLTYQVARPNGKIQIDVVVGGEAPLESAAEQLLENLIARTQ